MVYSNDLVNIMRSKIKRRDFDVSANYDKMYITVEGIEYVLSDSDVKKINNISIEEICSCFQCERIRGLSAEEFYNLTNSFLGYRLFRLVDAELFSDGITIHDDYKKGYGHFFTIHKSELFRFIITAGREEFGEMIAEISFKNNDGSFIKDANIIKGRDTDGTYRAYSFNVKKTYSLNNYKLIRELFELSPPQYKNLITSDWFYESCLKYYKGKEQLCNAMIDIHNEYKFDYYY